MANLHLVTGYAGQKHVTSNDQGSFNAAIVSDGEYVLLRGNQFRTEVLTNVSIRVFDGDAIMQGRHIRLKENTSIDLTFENGTQGKNRIDIIAIQYTKNTSDGTEESNLIVKKGESTNGTPAAPELVKGDILSGNAIINEMPLYKVYFEGLYIQPPVKVFETIASLGSVVENIRKELEEFAKKTKEDVIASIPGKQDLYKTYNFTLLASDWKGEKYNLTYDIPLNGIKSNTDVSVLLHPNLSFSEAKAWSDAGVLAASQTNNKITLKGFGEKPVDNIRIVIEVGSDTVGGA